MDIRDTYLDQRFDTIIAQHESLPFFHCCDAIYLQGILNSRALKPKSCDIYKEDLLYLFYGRPAYRSSDVANSRLNFMMPVCFIINYEKVSSIRRAVGFDSGAYNRYSNHLHTSMRLEEFHLTPAKSTLNKMVNFFFESNEAYFEGDAKKDLHYDPFHFQLESYHSIITGKHKTDIDDRKLSIEVQLNHEIPLNSAMIEAIILPKALALSPIIKDIISDTLHIPLIEIKNYGVAAKDYYVHLLQEARTFLVDKKLIEK